ncbi:MAG: DUF669 domain-containing protein [Planctomycetia bacterium]
MDYTKILSAGNAGGDDFDDLFAKTKAVDTFQPLPDGVYECHVDAGELTAAKTGTKCYRLKLRVLDGDHAGRLLWKTLWLSPAALPRSKAELEKLGVTTSAQMRRPFPPGVVVRAVVKVEPDQDGEPRNEVKKVAVVRIESPSDPFALDAEPSVDDGEVTA